MTSKLSSQKERIDKMGDLVHRVSDNFKELDIFKGRYLRHIYVHKKEVDFFQNEM